MELILVTIGSALGCFIGTFIGLKKILKQETKEPHPLLFTKPKAKVIHDVERLKREEK